MSTKKRTIKPNPSQKPFSSLILPNDFVTPKYFANWKNIPLPYGQRGEQQEIDTWRALVTNPDFQKDIMKTQELLDASYWRTVSPTWRMDIEQMNSELSEKCSAAVHSLQMKYPKWRFSVCPPRVKLQHELAIEYLVKKWALDDLTDGDWWLEHVLRYWTVNSNEAPPLEAPMRWVPLDLPPGQLYQRRRMPLFKTVMVSVEQFAPSLTDSGQAIPRRATITLRPGATIRQAREAAGAAVKSLGSRPRKDRNGRDRTGRVGLTDYDRLLLEMLFSKYEHRFNTKIPSLSQIIGKVWETLQGWKRPISRTKIGDELRRFRSSKGHPVRRYTTE